MAQESTGRTRGIDRACHRDTRCQGWMWGLSALGVGIPDARRGGHEAANDGRCPQRVEAQGGGGEGSWPHSLHYYTAYTLSSDVLNSRTLHLAVLFTALLAYSPHTDGPARCRTSPLRPRGSSPSCMWHGALCSAASRVMCKRASVCRTPPLSGLRYHSVRYPHVRL